MTLVIWYLWICLGIFILGLGIGLIEDVLRGPDHKFGFNVLTSPFESMWLFMVALVACPIVNLFVIGALVYAYAKPTD